jgi:Cytochrome c
VNIRRIAKWTVGLVLVAAALGFLAFLYFIPPFTVAPPEAFIAPEAAGAQALDSIADAKTRALSERGKYLVMVTGCADCHTTPGANGPDFANAYLAGGLKTTFKGHGTFVSANLTTDPKTGLARRTDDDVKRVLASGVSADGRQLLYRDMPWAWFSNWTEEDRHAVVVYLRQVRPVAHAIPAPAEPASSFYDPAAVEEGSGLDWGTKP